MKRFATTVSSIRIALAMLVLMLIAATGSAQSLLSANPSTVDFGSVLIGASELQDIGFAYDGDTIHNVNMAFLTHATIIGDSTEFTIQGSTSVMMHNFGAYYVKFTPTSYGAKTAVLLVTSDSGDVSITLHGIAISHKQASLAGSMSDTTVAYRETRCFNFFLSNTTGASISLNSITLSTSNPVLSLSSLPSMPETLANTAVVGFQVCVDGNHPIGFYDGIIHAVYTVGSESDTVDLSIRAGIFGDTLSQCLALSAQDYSFSATRPGDSSSVTVSYTNASSDTVSITGMTCASTGSNIIHPTYSSAPSFPIVLAPGATGSIGMTMTIPMHFTTSEVSATLTLTSLGHGSNGLPCHNAVAYLTGKTLVPLVDTSDVDMHPGSGATISLSSDASMTDHLIRFHNNSSPAKQVYVRNAALTGTDASYFSVVSAWTSSGNDTLGSGDEYELVLRLDPTSLRSYSADIALTIEDALTTIVYHVNVTPKKLGVAPSFDQATAIDMRIYPNPSHGVATISLVGTSRARFEVLDLLGRVVMSGPDATEWTISSLGQTLGQGAYFVRATGVTESGTPFVTTKRLVVE